MDRILESRNVESMRKMMVMQEQVFKQQVEELHRLYDLQKKLMKEIGNGLKQQKRTTAAVAERGDDRKEASVSNSGESSRMLINFDLESTPSKRIEEGDMEVDLTLSIGHSTRIQRSKSTHLTQLQTSKGEECGEAQFGP